MLQRAPRFWTVFDNCPVNCLMLMINTHIDVICLRKTMQIFMEAIFTDGDCYWEISESQLWLICCYPTCSNSKKKGYCQQEQSHWHSSDLQHTPPKHLFGKILFLKMLNYNVVQLEFCSNKHSIKQTIHYSMSFTKIKLSVNVLEGPLLNCSTMAFCLLVHIQQ